MNRDSFTSSFPVWISFVSFFLFFSFLFFSFFFFLPNCSGKDSTAMLNSSGKSRHTCLVSVLGGKLSVFHH